MTSSEIESFLAVCRYKTVSLAAERLHITQSSLSIRLKTLEKELGGELFYRRKGSRSMTLTAAGKQFYDLAIQYEALMKQMQQVCQKTPAVLRVSSLNSVDTFLLPAVYELFLQRYPDMNLELQDMDYTAASVSIQNGDTDLAFTSTMKINENLKKTMAFVEPMVLISSVKDWEEPVRKEMLSLRNEVYIGWSSQFEQWHQETFGHAHPQLSVSIMLHLQKFMEREKYWTIVPISVAKGLEKTCSIYRLETDFPLPKREMSIVSAANKPDNAATLAFYDCLREVLAAYPEIETKI